MEGSMGAPVCVPCKMDRENVAGRAVFNMILSPMQDGPKVF